jgi:hypothetical protein
MKKIILLFLSFIIISFYSSTTYSFEGPLQVKNQFPLFLDVDAPFLETASIENSFSANFSYSTVYLVRESSEWSIGLDMEIAELDLRFRKNIKDFIEVGVDLPFLSFNSGFTDDFLRSYHNAFGFPDYGRSNRPDNEFLYEEGQKRGRFYLENAGDFI